MTEDFKDVFENKNVYILPEYTRHYDFPFELHERVQLPFGPIYKYFKQSWQHFKSIMMTI